MGSEQNWGAPASWLRRLGRWARGNRAGVDGPSVAVVAARKS